MHKIRQNSKFLLILNGAILTVCAVFVNVEQHLLFIFLLLFLPLVDRTTRHLDLNNSKSSILSWMVVAFFILFIVMVKPEQFSLLPGILLLTALPEEWFFRRYFQRVLHTSFLSSNTIVTSEFAAMWIANITASLFFTLLHMPLQGVQGLSVFFPSLFLGWLYQFKQDIVLVILVHGLFNLFYISYMS